jgi:acyl-CoA reductase-like NAD-dependent aldehyde dehydrogenase
MSTDLKQLCERHHHYIAGEWVAGDGDSITLIDPYTEQVFGCAPSGNAALVDRAVEAAQTAQPAWAKLSAPERAGWLTRWLQALHPQAENIGQLISREMGAPISPLVWVRRVAV